MKNNHDRISPATYIVSLMIIVFCVYASSAGEQQREYERASLVPQVRISAEKPRRILPTAALPNGVGKIEGDLPVYYGPQLDGEAIYSFISDFDIAHVVDLASEAKAEAILDGATEQAICTRFGTQYYALNIEGADNRLNQQVMASIDSLVGMNQPIFIHCRNGIHRAKVTAGRAYARDGYPWQAIVDLLEWAPIVNNPKYDRYTNDLWEYAQGFNYPLNVSK